MCVYLTEHFLVWIFLFAKGLHLHYQTTSAGVFAPSICWIVFAADLWDTQNNVRGWILLDNLTMKWNVQQTERQREREREKASSTPKLIQRISHFGARRSNQKNEHVMNDCNIALCGPLTIIHIIHIIGHLRFQIAWLSQSIWTTGSILSKLLWKDALTASKVKQQSNTLTPQHTISLCQRCSHICQEWWTLFASSACASPSRSWLITPLKSFNALVNHSSPSYNML